MNNPQPNHKKHQPLNEKAKSKKLRNVGLEPGAESVPERPYRKKWEKVCYYLLHISKNCLVEEFVHEHGKNVETVEQAGNGIVHSVTTSYPLRKICPVKMIFHSIIPHKISEKFIKSSGRNSTGWLTAHSIKKLVVGALCAPHTPRRVKKGLRKTSAELIFYHGCTIALLITIRWIFFKNN